MQTSGEEHEEEPCATEEGLKSTPALKQPIGLDVESLRDLIQAFIRDQGFKSDLPMLTLLERIGCARAKFGKELMTYGIVQEVMRVEERKAVRRTVANE